MSFSFVFCGLENRTGPTFTGHHWTNCAGAVTSKAAVKRGAQVALLVHGVWNLKFERFTMLTVSVRTSVFELKVSSSYSMLFCN